MSAGGRSDVITRGGTAPRANHMGMRTGLRSRLREPSRPDNATRGTVAGCWRLNWGFRLALGRTLRMPGAGGGNGARVSVVRRVITLGRALSGNDWTV